MWQGLGKHLVDNAPSVGILSCSKNQVDARDKNIQQRAKSLSLAGALVHKIIFEATRLYGQFLAGPNHRTLILINNPDIRSARLYGQFSLDKMLTLQAGSTV